MQMNRREFLFWLRDATASFVAASVPRYGQPLSRNRESFDQDQPVGIDIQAIESMSEEELLRAVMEYPILPEVDLESVGEIIQVGREKGLNPQSLAKVGSSVAANSNLIVPLFQNRLDLGEDYDHMKSMLDYFRGGTWSGSLQFAARLGYNFASLSDPMLCGGICNPGENTIEALMRKDKPAVTFHFIGTVDKNIYNLSEFEAELEQYLQFFIASGSVPVLTTFPHPIDTDDSYYSLSNDVEDKPAHCLKYNLVIARMAEKHNIPLINVFRGLHQDLSSKHYGTADSFHFSSPDNNEQFSIPDGDHLKYGSSYVNLLVLQTLEQIYPFLE